MSPEYDSAKGDLKAAERGLEEYLDRQRQRLGCRVSTTLFYFPLNPVNIRILNTPTFTRSDSWTEAELKAYIYISLCSWRGFL